MSDRYIDTSGATVRRSGVVTLRGAMIGRVKKHWGIWVRRYKTVPDKHYDGWVATPLEGPAAQFHHRREAVEWLVDPAGYPGSGPYPRRVVECPRDSL